jgi:hypothetical protein
MNVVIITAIVSGYLAFFYVSPALRSWMRFRKGGNGKEVFYAEVFAFYFLSGIVYLVVYSLSMGEGLLSALLWNIGLFVLTGGFSWKLYKDDLPDGQEGRVKLAKRTMVYLYIGLPLCILNLTALFILVLTR